MCFLIASILYITWEKKNNKAFKLKQSKRKYLDYSGYCLFSVSTFH